MLMRRFNSDRRLLRAQHDWVDSLKTVGKGENLVQGEEVAELSSTVVLDDLIGPLKISSRSRVERLEMQAVKGPKDTEKCEGGSC